MTGYESRMLALFFCSMVVVIGFLSMTHAITPYPGGCGDPNDASVEVVCR